MVNRIAELLREHGAVEYGEFVLASGARSTYYINVKSALTSPEVLVAVGEEISSLEPFDVVAGVAVGGVPIAVSVSIASRKPYAIVRESEKTHGKSGRVIGEVSGRTVLLVEDVTTSGGSVLAGIEALRAAGATVRTVVTIVDRQAGAGRFLEQAGVRLRSLSTADELVKGGK
ncbi:MAG: orotate phosphoribosyltransferase [Methanoregulaceae archaeon]|jgi:orotate phosphoribosyltransferase|nr:orotate phosphoribosyltransferase [Methanoregulaceae archaeon]